MKKFRVAGVLEFSTRLLSAFLILSVVFTFFGGVSAQAETADSAGNSVSSAAGTVTAPYASISGNITIPQGENITFTLTGDAYFVIGSSGVISSVLSSWMGDEHTYSVGAVGEPGSSTGLYLVAPGQEPQKFCVITVGPPEKTEPGVPSSSTRIDYSDNYYYLRFQNLKQNEMMYSEIAVSDPSLSLSIASSNDNVILVSGLQKEEGNPGHYVVALFAAGEGDATLTITASDGTIDNMPVTVQGVLDKDYTLTSDTTQDFTIPQNGSYFVKVNYTYSGPTDDPTGHSNTVDGGIPLYDVPLLVSDNPYIQVTPVTRNGSEFLFRIDAFGNVGQSATLYTGSYNYIPEELCKVTIAGAPKNIRLDTTTQYECNGGDSYRFVAYTSSPTPPAVSANNDLVSVQYVQKVNGGYEYRMTAKKNRVGYSLVRVTLGGETASFPVLVDNTFQWSVESDTHQVVSLAKGESYTYKFTIMGGGEPKFTEIYNAVPTTQYSPGILTIQLVKKDGLNYYVKVTANSDKVGDTSYVGVLFPNSAYYDPNSFQSYGTIQIKSGSAPAVMKSDTTSNFTLMKGASYTFRITGATKFSPGMNGVFNTELIRKSGNDSYYRITATGQPGQQVGFYMSNGSTSQRVCVVTVGAAAPVTMKSDTTHDFSLAQGKSYTFKITGATSFVPGSSGVFKTELVNRSGSDSYYKITAIGKVGSSAGFYMSVPGQPAQKVCAVSVA